MRAMDRGHGAQSRVLSRRDERAGPLTPNDLNKETLMSKTPPSLHGKIALVTGASRGIGRGIAQRLARAGATVVVTARSLNSSPMPGTLAETVALIEAAGGRAIALRADLDDRADLDSLVASAVEATGGLDILVNNAGKAQFTRVDSMPDAVLEEIVH